jgi:hypothetical protein
LIALDTWPNICSCDLMRHRDHRSWLNLRRPHFVEHFNVGARHGITAAEAILKLQAAAEPASPQQATGGGWLAGPPSLGYALHRSLRLADLPAGDNFRVS